MNMSRSTPCERVATVAGIRPGPVACATAVETNRPGTLAGATTAQLVQVEGIPAESALEQLRSGVALGDFTTRQAQATQIEEPAWLRPRDPPVRARRSIPTSWLEITLHEGKNRQVRRMTAAVGLPTLSLIRFAVGAWTITDLAPGLWRETEIISPNVTRPDSTAQAVAAKRQPFRPRHVIGRAIPHPLKKNKR